MYHLYVCPKTSKELHRHIAFRDYLRAHPSDAVAYSDEVAQRIDEIVNSIKGLMTEVAIVEYSNSVA